MLTLSEIKATFFTTDIANGIDRAAKKGLSRFGAFVRQRDKTSLKYGKKKSPPGSPPVVHRSNRFTRKKKIKGVESQQPSSPLRELIYFGYDPAEKSVLIGPVLFGSKAGSGVARVIEEGGTGPIVSDGKVKIAKHEARPHTGPAFRAELPRAAGYLKDLIR